MKINKYNYEVFFLDYWENNLSAGKVVELMKFLEQHPELKNEFNDYEHISLNPERQVIFNEKDKLKKEITESKLSINETNYEELIIADIEGELDKSESADLKKFLESTREYKQDYNYYKSTILIPDLQVGFGDKRSLKKIGIFTLYRKQALIILSVAASIIILLGIYLGGHQTPPDLAASRDIIPANKTRLILPEKINNAHSPEPHIISERNFTENIQSVAIDISSKENSRTPEVDLIRPEIVTEINIAENALANKIEIRNKEIADESASFEIDDKVPARKNKKSFVSRFISGLTRKVNIPQNNDKKTFLEYTVKGYNIIADRDVEVEKELDDQGKVMAYNIIGEKIVISRKKKELSP